MSPSPLRWALSAGAVTGGALATAGVRRYAAAKAAALPDPLRDEPFGELHTEPIWVRTADDVELCVEVEEARVPAAAGAPTLVFIAGFCLSMDAWHFQRREFAGEPRLARTVFYDQRGHGRSGRGAPEHSTIEYLVEDLRAVLAATAPDGPVVLVGHSLGGMVTMAYAAEHPAEFAARVRGAALITTSAGRLNEMTLGFPAAVMRRLWPVAPLVVGTVATNPLVVRRGMKADRTIGLLFTRRFSFGRPDTSRALARFAGATLSSTPLDVFAEFFTVLSEHDTEEALPLFRNIATLVVGAERDLLTPLAHSRTIAAALPKAELLVVPEAGHLVQLEDHAIVNAGLGRLLDRVRLGAQMRRAGARSKGRAT
ncbi:MAG: alpha/beta fold hydrolase [Sporichthyaceae bacterium]